MIKHAIGALAMTGSMSFSTMLSAQDIHYTQFEATPMTVNPSYTGMFDGKVRAAVLYRNEWKSVVTPYTTTTASVDLPLVTFTNNSYLAAGTQLMHDIAGDGNLNNFNGTLSVAFHKLCGYDSTRHRQRPSDLAVGLQVGYNQDYPRANISDLYFGSEPYTDLHAPYNLWYGNTYNSYTANAGISFSRAVSPRFNYSIGISCNNFNQPNDPLLKVQNEISGLAQRYTGSAGFNWTPVNRLSVRPAALYLRSSRNGQGDNKLIAGSEFQYKIKKQVTGSAPAVFLGGWYRTGDTKMATAGYQSKRIRIGISYDFRLTGEQFTYSSETGGFDVMLRYTASRSGKSSRKPIPCDRF